MSKKIRTIFFALLLILVAIAYMNKKTVNKNKKIATLLITGKTSSEQVAWKTPSSSFEEKVLLTYEVILSIPGQAEKKEFFFGDLIGIRYKTLELYPFFHWIGFQDPIEIESLFSDYLSAEKRSRLPSKFVLIDDEKKIQFLLWKKMFHQAKSFFFVRRASLQSEYFPLEKQSFSLAYESGELKVSKS